MLLIFILPLLTPFSLVLSAFLLFCCSSLSRLVVFFPFRPVNLAFFQVVFLFSRHNFITRIFRRYTFHLSFRDSAAHWSLRPGGGRLLIWVFIPVSLRRVSTIVSGGRKLSSYLAVLSIVELATLGCYALGARPRPAPVTER